MGSEATNDANMSTDLDADMQITHEQVQDVYMAGTSDGVIFLENGKTRQAASTADRPDTR